MKRHRHSLMLAICAASACGLLTSVAQAYTPKSPEVRRMIDKGVEFLSNSGHRELGGRCLVALAIIKAPLNPDPALADHPKVKSALEACQQAAKNQNVGETIYNYAVAAIFLSELNKITETDYTNDIKSLFEALLKVQKGHGGWGYTSKKTGDTSQTQYGVLCCWYAKKSGIEVPLDSVERVSDWLLRTQDQSGAWGYQGVMDAKRQTGMSLSLSSAAAGSLYICADMLQVKLYGGGDNAKRGPNSALVEVKDRTKKPKHGPLSDKIGSGRIRPVLDRGNQWFDGNFAVVQDSWNYYYLYALERYKSFQEMAQGKSIEEPKWYNDVVEYMMKAQRDDGSFNSSSGRACATAFAVLFLTRSTQKSIGPIQTAETEFRGGHGLPDDVSNVRENKDGKVIKPQIVTDITKLVDALNDPSFELDEDAMQQVMQLPLDKVARDQDAVRLRKMVSAESVAARLVAVRALAKARKLENVPVLIYALGDPNNLVKAHARDGLRLISRKFAGFRMPDRPTEVEVQTAKANWKKWYLSIQPDGELLD